jgi:hypothetical protein
MSIYDDLTWYVIIHPHQKSDDYKGHICHNWLKYTGDKNPLYSHASLMIHDGTHFYTTTTGVFVKAYKGGITECLTDYNEDGTIAIAFTPDDMTVELFNHYVDNVNIDRLSELAFIEYALNLYTTRPVCVQWVQYVIGLYSAGDANGKPIFKRSQTETPSSLVQLLEDINDDTCVIVYVGGGKVNVYPTLSKTGLWV